MELECSLQKYSWGKIGLNSVVAQFAKGCCVDPVDPEAPYAELWMGTHPNGMSYIRGSSQDLQSFVGANTEVLGEDSIAVFGHDLPFLFKVLSVRQALSIQAHPDKDLANVLHKTRPDLYKDANHKPEMAIALTKFTALCGFRPRTEIVQLLQVIPEIREAVGEENFELLKSDSDASIQGLKETFRRVMEQPKEDVARIVNALALRLKDEAFVNSLGLKDSTVLAEVWKTIHEDFKEDVGLIAMFLFNLIVLEPGDAIYLGANDPHAYLSGDCVECMACSDNVVRAGLTPKFIDVDTLVKMLVYKFSSPEEKLFRGVVSTDLNPVTVVHYTPPIADFKVMKYELKSGTSSETNAVDLPAMSVGSIVIVIEAEHAFLSFGDGEDVELIPGKVFFVPAGKNMALKKTGGSAIMFRASANVAN